MFKCKTKLYNKQYNIYFILKNAFQFYSDSSNKDTVI